MADIKKFQLKDVNGNLIYPKTSADVVVYGESTVSNALDSLTNAIADKTPCSVVATIAERDALTPLKGDLCWVEDATGDSTVSSGAAKYLYNGTTWVKVSEAESMDVVLDWANLQNKPSSAVADIDDAVSKAHEHSNKALLDSIEDGTDSVTINGKVFYAGRMVAVIEADGEIPADMNSNGIVFEAI